MKGMTLGGYSEYTCRFKGRTFLQLTWNGLKRKTIECSHHKEMTNAWGDGYANYSVWFDHTTHPCINSPNHTPWIRTIKMCQWKK